jgi:C4-dicarboxylate transporter DctM subunit
MKKSAYDSDFSAAVLASGGSIGVIIPPSIPMIIFGFLTGASIGQLFAGGILPGLLVGISLIAVATLISRRRGYGATQPFAARAVWHTFRQAILALGAPLIILGGILLGIFTATESAAVAVVYALVVSLGVYRELKWRQLPRILIDASVMASVVMFIIAAASIFSWIAAIEELPARLAGVLLDLTTHRVLLLLLMNLILLVAGTFVETTAALILLVPMMVAMLPALGIDLVQLGVIVVTNLAIGMLTPPMGICLIVAGTISGDRLGAIAGRIVPFLLVLLIDLMVVTFYAPLTMVLARLVAH